MFAKPVRHQCRLPDGMELGERFHVIIGTHRDLFSVPMTDPTPTYAKCLGMSIWSSRDAFVAFCMQVDTLYLS